MESGQRVTVLDGPFKGTGGAVIKDERFADPVRESGGTFRRDRVWVLLDVGDNPQRYPSRRLKVR